MLMRTESKYLEFKAAYSTSIYKTVSAYANFHDGEIVLGIQDDGQIVGLEAIDDLRLTIENTINDVIQPRPYFEFQTQQAGDKSLLILKVFQGEFTPYLYQGKAYMRSDTATVPVDRYHYSNLILQGHNQNFEDLVCEDQNLSFGELELQFKRQLGITQLTPDLLKTLQLIKDGHYNQAAALLSDNNPLQSAAIDLIAFMDQTVKHIRDRDAVEQVSLLKQFSACLDFYHKHINRSELIEGIYREIIDEIPLVAYREAIANLIIHRDYALTARARVEIFSDRIEIISPGGLPSGLSEAEYCDGRFSMPRNPKVADVYFRLRLVEKLATGVRRIKESYQPYPVSPKFLITDHAITIVLPKVPIESRLTKRFTGGSTLREPETVYGQSIRQVHDREISQLSRHQQTVYQAIVRQPGLKRADLQTVANLGKTQTAEILQSLLVRGFIRKIGNGPSTAYEAE